MKLRIVSVFILIAAFVHNQIHAQKPIGIEASVVAYQPATSKQYIGSPSLAILPNGDYVASHDFFGPESSEFVQADSRIYRSKNKGKSWEKISEINGAFWSSLFVHKEVLYLLGPDRHHGTVLIRKSEDGGVTWTTPRTTEDGLLVKGMFHCAPMPVIVHNGRLWRAMETAHGPIQSWGKRYGAMMMSAAVDADLMKASSWTVSNSLLYDASYLEGKFGGWLEGNAVVAPNGEIWNMLRVDDGSTHEEKAAIVKVTADGKVATFDPQTGFIPFKGGSKKFAIRYDEKSKTYWTIASIVSEKMSQEHPKRNPASIRNTLVLKKSDDLINWVVVDTLLQHPDVFKHGFQYVDWLFEGKDIIWLCRTSADDGAGGANNNHDANFLTFHRMKNFRKFLKK